MRVTGHSKGGSVWTHDGHAELGTDLPCLSDNLQRRSLWPKPPSLQPCRVATSPEPHARKPQSLGSSRPLALVPAAPPLFWGPGNIGFLLPGSPRNSLQLSFC